MKHQQDVECVDLASLCHKRLKLCLTL